MIVSASAAHGAGRRGTICEGAIASRGGWGELFRRREDGGLGVAGVAKGSAVFLTPSRTGKCWGSEAVRAGYAGLASGW